MYEQKQLIDEMNELIKSDKGYLWTMSDIFALGYLAGKYNLSSFKSNKPELVAAIKAYDETDVLQRLDTIAETLIDHDILTAEDLSNE